MSLPNVISTLPSRGGHIQGIALDRENGWLYCSFTTELVKYDLEGNLLGSVTGLTGHLGCLAMGPDGRVYGSLEYKNDSIGRGIRKNVGGEFLGNAFYIAIFDGAKIDRTDMDACADAVMTTVYLSEVVYDYEYELEQPGGGKLLHRFGCSGIDGMTFAPLPGEKDGQPMLCVAYGIYGDLSRTDNDHQVILAYDTEGWDALARPLDQAHIHVSGPAGYAGKYFICTGNTTWGVQNLEYDPFGRRWLLAVYRGHKPTFPNYRMFAVDASAAPEHAVHNAYGESIRRLKLAPMDREENGIHGTFFPYGQTGMADLGGGYYYFAHAANDPQGQYAIVRLYKAENGTFVLVE